MGKGGFGSIWVRVAAVVVGTSASAQSAQAGRENLIPNAGFEDGIGHWMVHANNVRGSATVDEAVSRSGKRSLRLDNATPFGPHLYLRVCQRVPTQPFTTYRISCWVKGEEAGNCFIGGGPGWGLRKSFPEGTFDWREVSVEWSTGASAEDFELLLLTQSPTKACWIDDVEFVAVRSDEAKIAELQKSLDEKLEKQKERIENVGALAQELARADDPYVELGLSVARRFIGRIERFGLKQNMSWSLLQIGEVETVLGETEALLRQSRRLPGVVVRPGDEAVVIDEGVFRSAGSGRPLYFGGYGHFQAVFNDLPSFAKYGVSLIQDGRTGPSAMSEDGSPAAAAERPAEGLRQASPHGVKVDHLLSPHYFPAWAYRQAPELRNNNIGFIEFNIDHPAARSVIDRWLRTTVPAVKDQPSLLSYCLSNEPAYCQSGKDPHSRPKWVAYLKGVHGEIAALNALYGTSYRGFEDVPAPTRRDMPAELGERRAYYDWCRFNQVNFAEWHRWMHDTVHSLDASAKTHAKLLIPHALEQGMVHHGTDPELFCEATDIAGCDNVVGWGNSTLTAWPAAEFYYDLLHSFGNQPVFNSETHVIPDGFPPQTIPPQNTRAFIWQGFLHHVGATTLWVWEEPGPGGLDGSIYLRPGNIHAVGRALLDANRLADQITAINQARARVAILFSQASLFWQPGYHGALAHLHARLKFAGQKVTFVSERQLAENRGPDVDVILIARSTHVAATTITALRRFLSRGGKVILSGEDDLAFDPYHRRHGAAAELAKAPRLKLEGDAAAQHARLLAMLADAGVSPQPLLDAGDHSPVTDVAYRIVEHEGGKLVPLLNLSGKSRRVRLPMAAASAVDLLSGAEVPPGDVELAPMIPLLLCCAP